MSKTIQQLQTELATLSAQHEALKARQFGGQVTVKRSPHKAGVICVFGIGRNGAAFYESQWEKILGKASEIRAMYSGPNGTPLPKPTNV